MSEEVETQAQPEITLGDFIMVVKLIDICSKRGAFEGAELKDVGILRGRLADFIEANKPADETESEPEEETNS
jgi:hypothetical protein